MEILDIVNDKNEVIGNARREEIYSKELTHRIVHIMVFNDKKELFVQTRSLDKDYLPGFLCTSAGGHVLTGETFKQAALRELNEEIGLKSDLKLLKEFKYVEGNHSRFIQLFIANIGDQDISYNDGEVIGGEFYSLEKIRELVDKNEKIHPQLKVCFDILWDKQKEL